MHKLLFIVIFLSLTCFVFAQSNFKYIKQNVAYEDIFYNNIEAKHTSIYPFIASNEFDTIYKPEKLLSEERAYLKDTSNRKSSLLKMKFTPVLSALYYQSKNSEYMSFAKGFSLSSEYKKHISLNISAIHNNETYAKYISERIDSTNVIPHYGRKYSKRGDMYSYFDFRGYLSYSASKYINFQIGKDRNFIGDGYRSLFLSDNANPLSFIKTTVEIWKVKYLIMYNLHRDVNTSSDNLDLNEKYSVIHYLSWNIGKRVTMNLFESVVWRGADSTGYRGYDINYLNPIIFFRPIDFSIGSPDNVIMGIGGKIRVFKRTHLYSQFLIDEFKLSEIKAGNGWWANKFGIQAGIKSFHLFKVKNLYFQSELNAVRPFTYSHTTSLENYGNYYQSLAHPLGANFVEGLVLIQYSHKRLSLSTKTILAKYGLDANGVNYGQNIYRSYDDGRNEWGNSLLQGDLNEVMISEFKFRYLVNTKWNLNFDFGYRFRSNKSSAGSEKFNYIFFGLKTDLFYNDVDY